MAYKTFPDFEAFWSFASENAFNNNNLSHHPCCDLWSTRGSKRSKASHTRETKWKTLLASLDSNAPDKKTALRTKMLEEGWRIPVLINRHCQAQSPRQSDSRFPFQPHFLSRQLPPLPDDSENEGRANQYASHSNKTHKLSSHQVFYLHDKELSVQVFPIAIWLPSQGHSDHKPIQTQENQEMLNKMMLEFTTNITHNMIKLMADQQAEKMKETEKQFQTALRPLAAKMGRQYSPRQRQGRAPRHPRPTPVQQVQVPHRPHQRTV